PEELLAALQNVREVRPDLWHAWAAVIRQLRFMIRLDEALEVVQQALGYFPLVPDLWVDLADIQQARLDRDAAIASLTTAHSIDPYWIEPLRQLSELYRQREEYDKAETLIERAIARAPLKAENHAILARFLWDCGKRHEAFERMRQALSLDPGFEGA